jgi:hypothetical protein
MKRIAVSPSPKLSWLTALILRSSPLESYFFISLLLVLDVLEESYLPNIAASSTRPYHSMGKGWTG